MKFLRKLRSFFRKEKLDREMTEEMRLHVEMQTELNRRAGMNPEDARYAALRQFGNVASIQEEVRKRRGWLWLENWMRDLWLAVRALKCSPGFSLTVILTLTLCIGANITVFSVLYGLTLKAMPYRDSGQLVEVYNRFTKTGLPKVPVGVGQYLDYRANANLFEGFALLEEASFTAGEESEPVRVTGARTTAEYFTLLGVMPLLGRFYTLEECVEGRDNVVVLTQTFWERQYRGDPALVGKTIRLADQPYTVIGVAPRSVETINRSPVFFLPSAWSRPAYEQPQWRHNPGVRMFARVKSGVEPAMALAQLATIEQRFLEQSAPPAMRETYAREGIQLQLGRIRDEQSRPVKPGLLLLQVAGALVLLLGCLNVASLMLARATSRQGEFAVRQALGAGRWALASQLFAESVLLGLAGAAAGVAVAWGGLQVINRYLAIIVRPMPPVELDGTILAVSAGVSIFVALAIGLLPMLSVWRTDFASAIQTGGRSATAAGGIRVIGGSLVVAQVALALMLLVGAGLLVRSFGRVMVVETGLDGPHLLHARVAFPASYSSDSSRGHRVAEAILSRLREIPGVEAAALTAQPTISGRFGSLELVPQGAAPGTKAPASRVGVSPEFFATLGLRVLEGRVFTAADHLPQARPAYVVDRNFAEKHFPGRSAVGQVFNPGRPGTPVESWPVVIGVVEPAKFRGPEDPNGLPFVFEPAFRSRLAGFSMVLHTARPIGDMLPLMRAQVKAVDSSLPLYDTDTVEVMFERLLSNRRGVMLLFATFAAMALVLSAVGLYGMLAFDVTRRTREIGIRAAIGATRGQIISLILRQGLRKAGLGLIIGLVGAFLLSRYLASLLFGVEPTDPVAFGAVSCLLLAVALLACWLPARRAAKVDPMVALRAE